MMFAGWRYWCLVVILVVVGFMAVGCGAVDAEEDGVFLAAEVDDASVADAVAAEPTPTPEPMFEEDGLVLIAHAGSALDGWQGSNSLEAMENAVELGFRYIELDMLTTSDGQIVLNHNWYHISNRIPGVENGIMSHAEFMSHRIFDRFTPVDLDMLIDFLREHPEPRIITDTKATEYAALYAIAERFPEYRHRFIAQAYAPEDVARIRALGFDDIILTIYMMDLGGRNPGFIHDFAVQEGLYAVAIPEELAVPAFVAHLDMDEMRYIVHTIDSIEKANVLHNMGFYAIYTGFLAYGDDGLMVMHPPVWRRAEAVRANMQYLDDDQRALLEAAIFYRLGVPVYVHESEVAPIWAYYLMSAPFQSPITGLVYLTARHYARYAEEFAWHAADRELLIVRNGRLYSVFAEDHGLFLYRDMVFLSENVLWHIFTFEVLRDGEYVVVVKDRNAGATAEDFLDIAKVLFAEN